MSWVFGSRFKKETTRPRRSFSAVENDNEYLGKLSIAVGADKFKDSDDKTHLFNAVENNNISTARKLIEDGNVSVNARNRYGRTPLSYATKHSTSFTNYLLEKGGNFGARVKEETTRPRRSLFSAVENDNEYLGKLSIAVGADKFKDSDDKTRLFNAVENNDISTARKLIEDGKVSVNARDRYGRTPLFYAINLIHSTSFTNYLLEKGGTFHLKDNCNVSVLSFFVEKCIEKQKSYMLSAFTFPSTETFELFQQQGNKIQSFVKAILNLVFCKLPLACCPVLDKMLKPNMISKETLSVAVAIASRYTEKDSLQKKRIFKNILTRMQEDITCERVTDILDSLIQLGANPGTADSDGNTALHYATRLPFLGVPQDIVLAICHQLKRFGVPFNTRNQEHETPLLFCFSEDSWILRTDTSFPEVLKWSKIVKKLNVVCNILLDSGSSLDEELISGETIFHLIIKLFHQILRINDQTTKQDVLEEAIEILHLFSQAKVEKKLAVNRGDLKLNSPLHLWATLALDPDKTTVTLSTYFQKFLKESLSILLKCGAQINARNEKSETPLHLCTTWSAVKLLIEAGANPKDLDSSGCSPLLAAAMHNKAVQNGKRFYLDATDDPEAFWRTAIEKGLDPWIVNKDGESVFSIVIRFKAFPLAKGLVAVACQDNYIQSETIAISLLNAICKDHSTRANWKFFLVKDILNTFSAKKIQIDVEAPLLSCCKNIIKVGALDKTTSKIKSNASPEDEQPPNKKKRMNKSTGEDSGNKVEEEISVHCKIVKYLRFYRVEHEIPKSCLDIAETYPALKHFLMTQIKTDEFPSLIPWTSVSKKYENRLSEVARRKRCEKVETLWYHKNHIGYGSYGRVFAGIDEKDGREVAIKRIENFRMQRPEDKREIQSLTALADCEQVVRYLYFIEKEDFSHVVLELMEGNLDEYLSEPFDSSQSIQLCEDVLMGLKYLHQENIMHRDLKPTNILFKSHPKLCLKLADFGLSRRIDSTSTTVYGTNAGTKCWIAPEILKSSKSHSKYSDIFSCGLILHYILSVKRHPFSPNNCDFNKGELQVIHETEANIIKDRLQGWDDSLSPEASLLLGSMLQKDEKSRPSAANGLIHPLFWSKKRKIHFLFTVGSQQEFQCPRAKRLSPLTAVEKDVEKNFASVVKSLMWNTPADMPDIYAEMARKRNYDTHSVVELVRFIRNAYAHVSECSPKVRKLLLEEFVFLDYFPDLFMEVFVAVLNHGWSQRDEIKYVLHKARR